MAAVLFQEAVDKIVEDHGPNAITRASLLAALNGIDVFDANGWMGAKDPKGGFSDCMVIMQVAGRDVRAGLPRGEEGRSTAIPPTSPRSRSTPPSRPPRSSEARSPVDLICFRRIGPSVPAIPLAGHARILAWKRRRGTVRQSGTLQRCGSSRRG